MRSRFNISDALASDHLDRWYIRYPMALLIIYAAYFYYTATGNAGMTGIICAIALIVAYELVAAILAAAIITAILAYVLGMFSLFVKGIAALPAIVTIMIAAWWYAAHIRNKP